MKLKSLCKRLSSGGSIDACEIKEKGMYPVFGGNGIRGYTNKYNFDGRCAIIGRQGANCGNIKYYEGKAFMTEHAIVVDTYDTTDAGYLSYKLSLLNLSRLQGQSAQPGLAVGTIADVDIEIPAIEIQQKIWNVLHSIDIKIDNNVQINNNLALNVA